MKLDQREEKLVSGLRKADNAWRWGKYVLASFGICGLVGWYYVYSRFQNILSEDPQLHTVIIPYLFPVFLFNCGIFGAMLGMAIRDWRGNAMRHLLLKLIDEQVKKGS